MCKLIFIKRFFFPFLFLLNQNFYSTIFFKEKILIENVFNSFSIKNQNNLLLDGLVAINGDEILIGNNTQKSDITINGLENQNTDYYLMIDEDNKLYILNKLPNKNHNNSNFVEVYANIINSYEDSGIKININNAETTIGSLIEKNIILSAKSIFLTKGIDTKNNSLLVDSKLFTNENITVNDSLYIDNILNNNQIIVENESIIQEINTNKKVYFDSIESSSNLHIENDVTVFDLNANIKDEISVGNLFIFNGTESKFNNQNYFLTINENNVVSKTNISNVFSQVEQINSENNVLNLSTDIFSLNSKNIILNNIFLTGNDLKINGKSIYFENNTKWDQPRIQIENCNIPVVIIENLNLLGQDRTNFFQNLNLVDNANLVFDNDLSEIGFFKLVANTAQPYPYGALMIPVGSSREFKKNIENLYISKEYFLKYIEPVSVAMPDKIMYFINEKKLKNTIFENIFCETENNEIVFNNKELLAILITQIKNIYYELDEIQENIEIL